MGGDPKHRPPPPPGAPWDASVDEAVFAFVDLEMTGLVPEKDRVLEVCIDRVRGVRTPVLERRLLTLVRPDDAAHGNAHVHGISEADVAGAPTFPEIAADVAAALDGAVLVAHAAKWDVAFLHAELARAGHPFRVTHWLDTLVLSRRAFALPSHALASLAQSLELAVAPAHRAGDDVDTLRALFAKVCGVLDPKTPRDLWETRVEERHARPEVLADCDRAREDGGEVTLVYRPRGKPETRLRAIVRLVVTDPEPACVVVTELPSRGRRSLRADRILRVERPVPAP